VAWPHLHLVRRILAAVASSRRNKRERAANAPEMSNDMKRHGPNYGRGRCAAFLFSMVDYRGDDCVRWPFGTDYNGAGQFGFKGKIYRAHRFMCELVHGKPPSRKHHAAHSCGKGHLGCVNPRHLSWKTQSENEMDKRLHGTAGGGARTSKGNGGCRTHLTRAQIADIRANRGVLPADVLAKRHGLKRGGIRYWQGTTHEPAPPGKRRRHSFPAAQETT